MLYQSYKEFINNRLNIINILKQLEKIQINSFKINTQEIKKIIIIK